MLITEKVKRNTHPSRITCHLLLIDFECCFQIMEVPMLKIKFDRNNELAWGHAGDVAKSNKKITMKPQLQNEK